MERTEWLKHMREKAEALYDHFAPLYWVVWGLGEGGAYREFLQKFLVRIAPHSTLLSAGCGAGQWDGVLLGVGHTVVGIDQSLGMLARAREHFPAIRYQKMGLQEMDFHAAFDGIICVDALEHIFPEEWPGILQGFRDALKPGGVLYFTVDLADGDDVPGAYERAKALGLPVVFGEVADRVDEAYEQMMALEAGTLPDGEVADASVYHYHPSLEQVRTWLEQTGLTLEDEGAGEGYEHFVVRKSA
ncbi:MAG: class I SAM-dependent methyltransferase [Anaerolineae bacterium]|nr:class I SAM-dependent methyltransferase [Anaerolineae bacterium]